MMNSYHYYYYYCYDYDDYPSCCCCSVLLNDFLSLDEHEMLHLETPLIFSVPQNDDSNGKNKNKKALIVCYFASCLRPSDITRTLLPAWFHWPWISQAWLSNMNMMFMQTHLTFHDDLLCSPAVYGLCTLSICFLLVYFSLYPFSQWLFALPTGFSQ